MKHLITGHEGYDSRRCVKGLGDMACGYSIDHFGTQGQLVTLFSAPGIPLANGTVVGSASGSPPAATLDDEGLGEDLSMGAIANIPSIVSQITFNQFAVHSSATHYVSTL